MSKRCPSRPGPPAQTGTARRWERRIFRNSFTRQGRTFRVKGWAFKVQIQGRRRTFSLAGATRAEAAREAQQLYDTILKQGWEAATTLNRSQHLVARGNAFGHLSARSRPAALDYWEQRLIQRRYREARLGTGEEFSVRIEAYGAHSYFPLGSNDPKIAATKAKQIQSTVLACGWTAAFERFEREITLAIFWWENPAAVTYTTLFTFLRDPPGANQPPALTGHLRKRIVVLEPDPTTHACLRYWLERQPGFACPGIFQDACHTLATLENGDADLLLVNRVAPDLPHLRKHLQEAWPGLPVFPYRVHEDSDQIFISISGVSGGYIFRRRLPTALFEPVQPGVRSRKLTLVEAGRHIRRYFQSFFGGPEPLDQPLTVALTDREQEILNHVSRGCLDKEIADLLNISIWTVHNHVKNIYEKLGVHHRTEAVIKYLQR